MLLSDKQNTQGAGATVAGDGAAGHSPVHILKVAVLINSSLNSSKAGVIHRRSGNKQGVMLQILTVSQSVLYISGKALAVVATDESPAAGEDVAAVRGEIPHHLFGRWYGGDGLERLV